MAVFGVGGRGEWWGEGGEQIKPESWSSPAHFGSGMRADPAPPLEPPGGQVVGPRAAG